MSRTITINGYRIDELILPDGREYITINGGKVRDGISYETCVKVAAQSTPVINEFDHDGTRYDESETRYETRRFE